MTKKTKALEYLKRVGAIMLIIGMVGCGVVYPEDFHQGNKICKQNGGLEKLYLDGSKVTHYCKDGLISKNIPRITTD